MPAPVSVDTASGTTAVVVGLPDVVQSTPVVSPRPSIVHAVSSALEVIVKFRFKHVKFQYLAIFFANIIILGQGCAIGWISPSIPILLSDRSPLLHGAISDAESSWIASTSSIGALIGTIFFGLLCSRVGSKNSTMLCAIPLTIFWLSVMFSQYAWQICIGRFMSGLTGGAFICIQLFIADISHDRIRGRLGSLLSLYLNIGILLGYTGGAYLDFRTVPYVMIPFPILFFCAFMCMPNTPQYLLDRGMIDEAEKSLRFYMNCKPGSKDNCQFQKEFQQMIWNSAQRDCGEPVRMSDFFTRQALRALIIGPTLMAISQFSGSFVLVNFAVTIFRDSGSDIDPNYSAMAMGVLQIIGAYMTSVVIDKVGRKLLLIVSAMGTAFGLAVMATYMHFQQLGLDVTHFRYVPLISLSFVLIVSSLGLVPVPYVIIAEVLPRKIRNIGATMCTTTVSIYAFIMLSSFNYLQRTIHLYGCILMFLSVALFGIVFIIFMVPETKGKSLDVLDTSSTLESQNKSKFPAANAL